MKKMCRLSWFSRSAFPSCRNVVGTLAVVLTALLTLPSHAATLTWTDAGTDWATGADWQGGAQPVVGSVAEFNTAMNNQPNIGAATSATTGSLWVATGAGQTVVIGGAGSLTIAGNVTTNGLATTGILLDDLANNGLTINVATTLGVNTSTSFTVNNAGTLAIHGLLNLSITNGRTLSLTGNNASGQIIIDGGIAATNCGITVNDSGMVTLGGTNLYTGATTVTSGTLNVTGILGATAVTVNGGVLVLGGSGALNQNTLTVNTGSVIQTANYGLTGNVATVINSGGSVTLSGFNTTTGAVTINNGGALQISGASGTAASTVYTLNGGSMTVDNTGVGNNNNTRIADNAAFTLNGGNFIYKGGVGR